MGSYILLNRRKGSEGVALFLAFVVFIVLTILVVSMLSIQRTTNRATLKQEHALACEFAIDSAFEACFSGIDTEGAEWAQGSGEIEIRHDLKGEDGSTASSYRLTVVPADHAIVPHGEVMAEVSLTQDQSYMNFSLAPVRVRIVKGETFVLEPYHGLLVIDASVGLLASERARVIVDVTNQAASAMDNFAFFVPGDGEDLLLGRNATFDAKRLKELATLDASGKKEREKFEKEFLSDKGFADWESLVSSQTSGLSPIDATAFAESSAVDEKTVIRLNREKYNDKGEIIGGRVYQYRKSLENESSYSKLKHELDGEDGVLEPPSLVNQLFAEVERERSDSTPLRSGFEGEVHFAGEEGSLRVSALVRDPSNIKDGFASIRNPFGKLDLGSMTRGVKNTGSKTILDAGDKFVEAKKLKLSPDRAHYLGREGGSGKLVVKGDIDLKGGELYVDGDVEFRGQIKGEGSVYVKGKTVLRSASSIASNEDRVALFSEEDIYLVRGTRIEAVWEKVRSESALDNLELKELKGAFTRYGNTWNKMKDHHQELGKLEKLLEEARNLGDKELDVINRDVYQVACRAIKDERDSMRRALWRTGAINENSSNWPEMGFGEGSSNYVSEYFSEEDYWLITNRLKDSSSGEIKKILRDMDRTVVGVRPELHTRIGHGKGKGASWWEGFEDEYDKVSSPLQQPADLPFANSGSHPDFNPDAVSVRFGELQKNLDGESGPIRVNGMISLDMGNALKAYESIESPLVGKLSFRGLLCSQNGRIVSQNALHVLGMIIAEKGMVTSSEVKILSDGELFRDLFKDHIQSEEVVLWLP